MRFSNHQFGLSHLIVSWCFRGVLLGIPQCLSKGLSDPLSLMMFLACVDSSVKCSLYSLFTFEGLINMLNDDFLESGETLTNEDNLSIIYLLPVLMMINLFSQFTGRMTCVSLKCCKSRKTNSIRISYTSLIALARSRRESLNSICR